jgi:hypothetical protein
MKGGVLRFAAIIVVAAAMAACSKANESGLRESFAQQLASNKFIKNFVGTGEDLTFSGPGAEGGVANWRVHIDSATIDPTDDPALPYKGTVKASWYSDNKLVQPRGRESNLPIELIDNGLAQECWAMWDKAAKRWSWE